MLPIAKSRAAWGGEVHYGVAMGFTSFDTVVVSFRLRSVITASLVAA